MRIALCSYELAGLRGGGIGTYVAEAAKALSGAGHDVWVVTARDGAEVLGSAPDVGGASVRYVEDADTSPVDVRFGLARRPLRFAQLAFDLLRQADVAFDYVEFPDYGGWGAVAVQEQRLFGSLGDAVVAVVLHSPTYECWRYNEVLHLLPPSERELMVLEDATIRSAPAVWDSAMASLIPSASTTTPADVATLLQPAHPPLLDPATISAAPSRPVTIAFPARSFSSFSAWRIAFISVSRAVRHCV